LSLRLRLLLALVPLFVLGLAAANIGTYAALQSFLLTRTDQQILAAHNSVGNYLTGQTGGGGGGSGGGGPGPLPGGGGSAAFPQNTYGQLRSATGTVIKEQTFGFGEHDNARPVLPANLKPGTRESPNLLTVSGTGGINRYRVYVDTADNAAGDILIVAIPLDDVDATLKGLVGFELAISGAVTLVLAGATWVIVRRSLRPLAEMGATARSIAASELHQRVEPATEKTEVGRLGLALNTMLEQLEAAFAARAASEERLRRFISDASHELRTPLTSMRGYAELLRSHQHLAPEEMSAAAGRIEDESRRLGVLVEDLLLLARLDQGRALERNRVDLEALVTDAGADAQVADSSRTISTRVNAPLVVVGDESRLRQVLSNLLRNALVHTPAGSPIEVVLNPGGALAVIEVVDHGPGIPEGDAGQIFERFHRADPERSRDRGGSGLGLSIAAAVVAAHQGKISVLPTPGGGATFRIELPTDPIA
jgi:two-component system OmpR family sensor kinase